MSTVQVIIPCYNYGYYLRSCVSSALLQDGVSVKVLIIDDCSTDNSAEIAEELARADKRVSFVRHKVNKGHIATYNEGLTLASSDYVVLLSADDLLTPGSLHRATELMDRNPSVGFVYGHPITFQGEAPSSVRTKVSGWTIWNGCDWIEMMCRTGRNFIVCPEVVMRTKVQHQIGGYESDLPHSGDMEMWLRAAAVSDVGRVRGVDQAYYRTHPLSMQRTVHAGFLFDLNARLAAFQSAFRKQADRLPDAERLLLEVRRALARTALRQATQAIKCGEKLQQPVQAYEQFALATCPEIVATQEWQRFKHTERTSQGPLSTLLARQIVDVRDRVIWRRWRRTGVYQGVQ